MTASASRRARRAAQQAHRQPPRATREVRRIPLSIAGVTASDAIRVNGRKAFFEKTAALAQSENPQERAVAEFMLRGIREAARDDEAASPDRSPDHVRGGGRS
jgi:hypothetical protein